MEENMHDVNPMSPDPVVVSEGDDNEQASSGKRVCSACRTVNEPAASYCYKCGVRLPDEIQYGAEAIGPMAGFWIRFAAYLIDWLFLGIIFFAISIIIAPFLPETPAVNAPYYEFVIEYEYVWWMLGIAVTLETVYFTVAIGAWGRTIGKAMLGIMVVRRDGSKVSYARSLARCLLYFMQLQFLLGLSFLTIAFDDEKQGIHDMMCDTGVVKV